MAAACEKHPDLPVCASTGGEAVSSAEERNKKKGGKKGRKKGGRKHRKKGHRRGHYV